MTAPALVILRADARSAWNRIVRGRGAARRGVIAFVASTLIFGPFVLGLAFFSGLALARTGVDPVGALTSGFAALVVLITGLGLSTVITAFFADRVLLLFALAPVRPRDVFWARLVSCSLPAWLVGTTVVALISGYGVARGVGPGFYLVGVLAVALTVFSTVSLLVAVLSLVLQVVPARRARDVANLAAALIGALFYLGWYGLVGGGQVRLGYQTVQRAASVGNQLSWLPMAWPAHALAAWAAGDSLAAAGWLGLVLAGAAATIGLAWFGYRRAFLVGVGVYGEGGAQRGGRAVRRAGHRPVAQGRPRPVLALAAKDLRTLRRDVKRLASVLPSLVMAMVYPLVFFRIPSQSGGIGFWVGMLSGAFVPFLLSTSLALPSIGAEGRGMQLLVLAGVRASVILRAKLSYIVPVVTVLGTGGGVIAALTRQAPADEKLAAVAAVAWLSAGIAAIGVGAGATAPNFAATDPQRAVHFQAGLVAIGGDIAFSLFTFGAVLLLILGRMLDPGLRPWLTVAALVPAAIAAWVVLGILALGNRRLASWTPGAD